VREFATSIGFTFIQYLVFCTPSGNVVRCGDATVYTLNVNRCQ